MPDDLVWSSRVWIQPFKVSVELVRLILDGLVGLPLDNSRDFYAVQLALRNVVLGPASFMISLSCPCLSACNSTYFLRFTSCSRCRPERSVEIDIHNSGQRFVPLRSAR